VLQHYREPIFRLLSQDTNNEYTFFADKCNILDSVATIPAEKANMPLDRGGLRWTYVRNIKLFNRFVWQRGVIHVAMSNDYDVIVYLGIPYFLSTWISCLLARLRGKRTIMWTHGFLSDETGLKGSVRKGFYRLAHAMLLYHNRARELMIKKGFDPANLYVVYNSLDYDTQRTIRKAVTQEQLHAQRRALFRTPDLPMLLFIGRLTPQKQLSMLIEAAHILKTQGTPCNVLIIGDGPERSSMLKKVEALSLNEHVRFYGPCHTETEIGPLIMAATLTISPGEVGLTCMHSLAYGTPVITHDQPDTQMPEYEAITPGHNGDFFKEGDVEDLAHIVTRWLESHRNRKDVVEKCSAIIEQYYNPHYQMKVIDAAIRSTPAVQID
jgi:glycosyltransferase involved in cell wall biosynthesis